MAVIENENWPRKLLHQARRLIEISERIESRAEEDPRLFGFASIKRSLARDNLCTAAILLEQTKPKTAKVLLKESVKQGDLALEDYERHKGHYATNEEIQALEDELWKDGLA